MKKLFKLESSKSFLNKPKKTQELILLILSILSEFGIPMDNTPRRLERMALAFLACGDVKSIQELDDIKDENDGYSVKTRDIIKFINKYFDENISSGSYDDIRRKDLKLLTISGIILHSNPNTATNDSTRGYMVNPLYAGLIRKYRNKDWNKLVSEKLGELEPLETLLSRERNINKIHVRISGSIELSFSQGNHNELQKSIIEEFLPRFGYGAELYYFGDTSNKYLFLENEKLMELNFLRYHTTNYLI